MAVSVSGVLTLAFLLFAGPLVWVFLRLFRHEPDHEEYVVSSQEGDEGNSTEDQEESSSTEDDDEGREQVDSMSYLMALLGYAIGIGNIWRFPYLVGKWGGGAFLVAYLCSLCFVALPLYLMEMGMGHSTRKSVLDCFAAIHPRWVGLGLAQATMIFWVLTYFNVLIAYSAVYVGAALQKPLPWSGTSTAGLADAETYWKRHVLNSYDAGDLDGRGLGPIQWGLAAALFLVWAIVFFSLVFGKKILAKVTWVTVVGPVVMLIILLIKALQLEGAGEGIRFYVGKFEVAKLCQIELWATACSQILFSLSPGFGTAITMSSFTHPREDVFRTCLIVSFCNSAFSITGGFAIFAILGNLAQRTGETVAVVASSGGPGLAFIAIAEGIQTFGALSNAMAVMFFMMLMALGMDSTFAWAETFVSIVDDHCRSRGLETPKNRLVGVICLVLFLLGLPFCTRMGNVLLDVVDHFVGSMFLLCACFVEVLVFNFEYTFNRLLMGIKQSTIGNPATPAGRDVFCAPLFHACLSIFVPCATGSLFMYLLYSAIKEPYEGYPVPLQIVGWTLLASCVIMIFATTLRKGSSSLPMLQKLQ